MRQSTLKTFLWQGLGILCYLAGMLLFLVVALGAFLAPPENSLATLSTAHVPYIVVSIVLIALGRYVTWKFGVGGVFSWRIEDSEPEKSALGELGYRVPPDATEESRSPYRYDDGEMSVVCPDCGTENDPDFTYCSECSAELPE